MSLESDLFVATTTIIIGVPITFYIKDYLINRANFKKFKAKLERIAGVNAEVLYQGSNPLPLGGQHPLKIIEIGKQGLVLQDKLSTVFVPIDKVLQTEIVVPADEYDTLRKERMKKDFGDVVDAMIPPLIDKLKEVIVTEMLKPDTELNAVVGVQIVSQLRAAGVDTSKLTEKKPTLGRLLKEMENKKGEPEKKEKPTG